MRRRDFLAAALACCAPAAARAQPAFPLVVPDAGLVFPRDHGQHADYRTEWWYVTGWLRDADGRSMGVQVTFFRSRPGVAEGSTSRFAPRQLVFAHAALADPAFGRLRHDQRGARAGFDLAGAADETTRVAIGDWSLVLDGDTYRARIPARDFALDLAFAATGPILLQGERGYSRKGPRAGEASFYYSRPHLAVSGTVEVAGRRVAVTGEAWLDHEWSSQYLAPEAVGWDWTGLNLDDGGALMAFRIRDAAGAAFWAGGSRRDAQGAVRAFAPGEVRFTPLRQWTSPRTGIAFPVAMRVSAGAETLDLAPLLDDQELDSRLTTGAVYWEGAVLARRDGHEVGRGYLELTGYGGKLAL